MAKEYEFKIEDVTYTWHEEFITGAQVRSVGPGIPENMDLFIKLKGHPGRLFKDDDKFDLNNKDLEKFYSQESNSGAGI